MCPSTVDSKRSDTPVPLRCVVLHHRVPNCSTEDPAADDTVARGDHLDWMFEVISDGELLTFATPVIDLNPGKLASDNLAPGEKIPMVRLPDHRRRYLDYEGPISNDRGDVIQIACGTYRTIQPVSDARTDEHVFCANVAIRLLHDSKGSNEVRQFQLLFQRNHWYCDKESSERVRKMAGVVWDGFLTVQRWPDALVPDAPESARR